MNRIILLACFAVSTSAYGQDSFSYDIGGLLFGDLYHVGNHHLESGDGATGAVLRRGYLTLNAGFGTNWEGRLRFELNQSGEFETYDFEADVKDLYLSRSFGAHRMHFGLSPTITFDLIESIWDARYLARTPLDMQGVASRDTGIAARGPLNSSGTLLYRFMLGTGIEFGAESGDGSKTMTALTWKPSENLYLDFYADYEKLAGPTDRTTLQLFAGYDSASLRWGLQYSYQDREEDPVLELASAFVVRPFRDDLSLIGRVDRLINPSPRGDNIDYVPFSPDSPATMILAGVEFSVSDHLRITPNILTISYSRNDAGEQPNSDIQYRLTLFLDYE